MRLILELCDQGSLRDALDGGCFLLVDPEHPEGPPALNYAAVLDTAMDIAKACIHLHRNNVLHTDLKARCVRGGLGGALGGGGPEGCESVWTPLAGAKGAAAVWAAC